MGPGLLFKRATVGLLSFTLGGAACAGNLPELASGTPIVATSATAHGPPTPATSASVSVPDNVSVAIDLGTESLSLCDRVIIAIPAQQLKIKRGAYRDKQVGLMITTAVGAVGSIVTAIVASQQKADNTGKVDVGPSSITGASTAGATAVAGVISLLAVGSGSDDMIAQLDKYKADAVAAVAAYNTACTTISTEKATECLRKGRVLANSCLAVADYLPYKVSGLERPRPRMGE